MVAIRTRRLARARTEEEVSKINQEFNDSNGEPNNLPEDWLMLKADFVCNFITKGTTPNTKLITPAGEIPFLKVQHIVESKLDFYSLPCFIPRSVHEDFLQRSKVYPGDVLMNIVGPPLNKVAMVPNDFPEWNINQALAIFRPLEGLDSKYLLYVLSNEGTLEHVLRQTRGVVGQSNISLDQCRNLAIPIPPISEQQEIVRCVEALFKTADALEARYLKAKAHVDKLTQSILAKAFRGELVPQDPNAEPASVLLERITSERNGSAGVKRRSRK
jgi:type I restriction enzyme S subunit